MTQPRLSICIATRNRAEFLAATLRNIIAQATSECEIIITDNASSDCTEKVVSQYRIHFERIRYFRHDTNCGVDRNFDHAVELATGEFCWLMPDDDLIKAGAIETVLNVMDVNVSVIAVNIEFMNFSMSKVVQRALTYTANRSYEPDELDRLYSDAAVLNGYIGSFVIRRSVWLARNRERYFGCYFIHIGMIYQARLPGKAIIIAQPLISMRMGNTHEWWSKHLDICLNQRVLVDSLAISQETKIDSYGPEVWDNLRLLVWLRALGAYSFAEYRQKIRPRARSIHSMLAAFLVALLPVAALNTLYSLYYQVTRRSWGFWSPDWIIEVLRESRIQHRKQHT